MGLCWILGSLARFRTDWTDVASQTGSNGAAIHSSIGLMHIPPKAIDVGEVFGARSHQRTMPVVRTARTPRVKTMGS